MGSYKLGNYINFVSSASWKDQDATYKIITDRAKFDAFSHQNGTSASFDYLVIFYVKSIKLDGVQWTKLTGNILVDQYTGSRTGTNYGYVKTAIPANSTVTIGSFDIYTVNLNYVPQGSHTVELTFGVYYGPRAPNSPVTDYQHDTTTFKDVVLTDTLDVGTQPATCELGIASTPGGAEIFLNEQSTGKFTPASGYVTWTLNAGTYRLVLKLAGYYDASELLTLAANTSTAKSYTLAKIPPKEGKLTVSSSPPGLRIRLNNSVSDKVTPYTFTLPEDQYLASVEFNGVWAADKTTAVLAGVTSVLNFDFSGEFYSPGYAGLLMIQLPTSEQVDAIIAVLRQIYDYAASIIEQAAASLNNVVKVNILDRIKGNAAADFLAKIIMGQLLELPPEQWVDLCQQAGWDKITAILIWAYGIAPFKNALVQLFGAIGAAMLLNAGTPIGMIAFIGSTMVGALGLVTMAIGTANFLAWADKEAVIETLMFNIDELINAEKYEEAIQRIDENTERFNHAVAMLSTYGTLGVFAAPIWESACASYKIRWADMRKIAVDKLAEIPEGVGVGQAKITLVTDPANVHIHTTGLDLDVITPWSEVVAQGTYEMVVSKAGYISQTVFFYCSRRMEYTNNIILKPQEAGPSTTEATLNVSIYDSVTSSPLAANLYVDNTLQSYHLSAYSLNLSTGTHQLRAEEEGYVTKSIQTASLVAGETYSQRIDLDKTTAPSPVKGTLTIKIIDAGTDAAKAAYVYLNGTQQSGHYSSYSLSLDAGIYTVKVSESGYYDSTASATVYSGQETVKTVSLLSEKEIPPPQPPPQPTQGVVSITTVPSKARIYINEILQAYLSPQRYGLDAGTYVFKVTKDGYEDYVETINVEAGKQYARTYVLKEITTTPQQTAWKVSILSTPSGAKILVNYEVTGKYTPDYVILNPGTYTIRVEKTGYYPAEKEITLEAF